MYSICKNLRKYYVIIDHLENATYFKIVLLSTYNVLIKIVARFPRHIPLKYYATNNTRNSYFI